MTEPRLFNVYCDESCHLEHDGVPVMAWGAVYCPADASRAISEAVRALKADHGLAHDFEAKWTKVSPAKADFYLALIDLFLNDERLRFRGLVVPDKSLLDHARFDQSHDDWYYKMYFTMLRPIFCAPHRYRIYLDVKDTRGGPKTRKLQVPPRISSASPMISLPKKSPKTRGSTASISSHSSKTTTGSPTSTSCLATYS